LIKNKPRQVKSLGMIVGGTGITPCLSILREVQRLGNDETKISMIFANQEEQDILVRVCVCV
jgi:cytochrome-b5 reductase